MPPPPPDVTGYGRELFAGFRRLVGAADDGASIFSGADAHAEAVAAWT